jgi:hypothetical protein
MFVQVIQGRVNDGSALKQRLEAWRNEVGRDAKGWLGATSGTSEDGEFVALVRFESEEAARANSDRPEQGAWWQETAQFFEGEPTFYDCTEVDTFLGGGSDDAGFVQIMEGRADREQLRSRAQELEENLKRMRPDVIGGIIAWHGDGGFTQAVYFKSEAEARERESQQLSEEDASGRDEMLSMLQDLRYIDLKDPLLQSA